MDYETNVSAPTVTLRQGFLALSRTDMRGQSVLVRADAIEAIEPDGDPQTGRSIISLKSGTRFSVDNPFWSIWMAHEAP